MKEPNQPTGQPAESIAAGASSVSPRFLKPTRQRILIAAIVVLMAVVSTLSPAFLTIRNLLNILEQLSIDAILGAGMTFVIISAGIDLSVGAVLALGGVTSAAMLVAGLPVPVGLLGGVGVGLLFGSVNGLAIAYARIPSFIMTLAAMNIGRGTVLFATKGNPISRFPETFRFLGKGRVGPMPMLVILTAFVYLVCHLALRKTRFGRYTFAIGNNAETARLLGIQVRRHTLALYALNGILAALGGMLLAARLNSALTLAGTGAELNVIAAVVIGGTSLYGGAGTMVGTLLGTIFLRIIRNSLNLLGVSPFLQQVAVGGLLVFSALGDILSQRLSDKSWKVATAKGRS